MSKIRNWCFTTYNLKHFCPPCLHKHFRYCVYQTEMCPKTRNIHHQGYIEFNLPVRMNAVKRACNDNTMHLEGRKGTREEARHEAMKMESRLCAAMEFGEWTGLDELNGVGSLRREEELLNGRVVGGKVLRKKEEKIT